jgi:MFS family permease
MLFMMVFGATVFNGIYPVLFNLFLVRAGYGPEYIGLANAVGLLSMAVSALPMGALARRWGLKGTIARGIWLAVGSLSLLPLADLWAGALGPALLVALYGLGSVGMTAVNVNVAPLLMRITADEERHRAFSVRTALSPLAGFFGSLLGGVLPGAFALLMSVPEETPLPYRLSLILGSVLCLPGLLVLGAVRGRERTAEEDAADAANGGPFPKALFLVLMAILVLRGSALGAVRTFFNLYLGEGLGMDTAQIGTLFSVIWLAAAPVALLMPRMAKRYGLKGTIIIASLGVAASALLMAAVPHWTVASLARFGVAGISSAGFAALNIFVLELVTERWRPLMAGMINLTSGLSWSALSLGGGYIIAGAGFPALFVLGAALTALGVGLFAWYFRVPRGEMAE